MTQILLNSLKRFQTLFSSPNLAIQSTHPPIEEHLLRALFQQMVNTSMLLITRCMAKVLTVKATTLAHLHPDTIQAFSTESIWLAIK